MLNGKNSLLMVIAFAMGQMSVILSPSLQTSLVSNTVVSPALGFDNNSNSPREITTVKISNESMPTVFHCGLWGNGMSEVTPAMAQVLENYKFYELKPRRPGKWAGEFHKKPMNPYDIFLSPLNIACNGQVERWLQQTFLGKLVYISGESNLPPSRPNLDSHRTVYMGPVPDNYHEKAMRMYYLQWVWWQYAYNKGHHELLYHHQKPQNTGKYFLIYAANNCVQIREQAFSNLAQIAPVFHGGRCRGSSGENHPNISSVKTSVTLSNWWDNVHVYHDYKFCLVMEHGLQEGYVTEKILMAFQGGCIPIYYGPKSIWDLFNKDSFIMYDIEDPQPALDRIRYLNENKTAYDEMLRHQPILADGNATIQKYFSFNESVGGGQLKKHIRTLLGLDNFKFVKQ